jgi:hypothetical protein
MALSAPGARHQWCAGQKRAWFNVKDLQLRGLLAVVTGGAACYGGTMKYSDGGGLTAA